jgi:hypothetical protein
MSKNSANEVLPADLREHRAVKAWRQIGPECFEPEDIQILKHKRKKSAVYRLTRAGSNDSAVIAKGSPATTASVERVVYEKLLSRFSLPALRCYGFVPEPEGEWCWLFLQDAGAHEYSQDNAEHRILAGRWLGTVHRAARFADLQTQLPDRGPGHYLQLLRSSRSRLRECISNPVLSSDEVVLLQTLSAQYDMIESHWAEVESFCERSPRTLVHGDFVIKNLRIQPGASGPALLVYDWEMAGWGFPATDLAQVSRSARPDLEVYFSVLREGLPRVDFRDIQRLADYGNMLRLVDKIYWETITMQDDSYAVLSRPLRTLMKYEPQLVAALRQLDWRDV